MPRRGASACMRRKLTCKDRVRRRGVARRAEHFMPAIRVDPTATITATETIR